MRRSSRTPAAPAAAEPALTRAELRRRAEAARADASTTEVPLTRRSARPRFVVSTASEDLVTEGAARELADATVAVEDLPDLAPEALELPDRSGEVPVVVETAAAAVDAAAPATASIPVAPPRADQDRHHAAAGSDDLFDEFEAAARLFSFTGETPVQVAASALDDAVQASPVTDAPRRRGRALTRVATASFSVGVLGVVGLLTVGMTTPLEAVAAAKGTTGAAFLAQTADDVDASEEDIQAYVAPSDVQKVTVERSSDNYEATSLAQIAAESGIANFSNFFVNDPSSAVQWPFAVGVPITYGFGMRSGNMHEGMDFVPGAGAPIQAIADGTVRIATESGGAYGVTVVIDHVIDGELISSRYAHMQYDSLQVETGDQVAVGTFIGRTGNTGRSFGAHMHFELLAGGSTAMDPEPWLREHAGG